MAAWRRRALRLFPQLRLDLQKSDYNYYMLFFDLLPMSREAHDANDVELLRHIYGFAEWCLQQKTKEPANAAAVAFFEHVLDHPGHWSRVVPWLSPQVIAHCWPLWEARLSQDELKQVRQLIEDRREHFYRNASRAE